jgi:hypothetical protein
MTINEEKYHRMCGTSPREILQEPVHYAVTKYRRSITPYYGISRFKKAGLNVGPACSLLVCSVMVAVRMSLPEIIKR